MVSQKCGNGVPAACASTRICTVAGVAARAEPTSKALAHRPSRKWRKAAGRRIGGFLVVSGAWVGGVGARDVNVYVPTAAVSCSRRATSSEPRPPGRRESTGPGVAQRVVGKPGRQFGHLPFEAGGRVDAQETAFSGVAILEIVRRATGDQHPAAARRRRPLAVDADAERAGEDVIDVVVVMGMAARPAGARLQPPLRQRVALGSLRAIGMEYRAHAAHVVAAALRRSRDQRLAGGVWRVHANLLIRSKNHDSPRLPPAADGAMVSPISRETTSARYITPTNISRLATARAWTVIGMTSPMPVLDISAKLRNSSSVHVRGACGSTAAEKQPGCKVWHNTNT